MTVAAYLVPQVLAYAEVAGLPPVRAVAPALPLRTMDVERVHHGQVRHL
ncbi:hypothetical protein [Ornithinimicrobium flavum]|nr:hypothetical protein [Ornithinimicrobium flavum]